MELILDDTDRRLVAAMQRGLPLAPRPYAVLAEQLGTAEDEVLERIGRLQDTGAIKRFGVVVRHRALGYRANAMVVWDVPDAEVDALGASLGAQQGVSLCYRRPRRLPDWPYNLFCMVHGRDRAAVRARIDELRRACGLEALPHAVLFSLRCFKQRGALYLVPGQGDGSNPPEAGVPEARRRAELP